MGRPSLRGSWATRRGTILVDAGKTGAAGRVISRAGIPITGARLPGRTHPGCANRPTRPSAYGPHRRALPPRAAPSGLVAEWCLACGWGGVLRLWDAPLAGGPDAAAMTFPVRPRSFVSTGVIAKARCRDGPDPWVYTRTCLGDRAPRRHPPFLAGDASDAGAVLGAGVADSVLLFACRGAHPDGMTA